MKEDSIWIPSNFQLSNSKSLLYMEWENCVIIDRGLLGLGLWEPNKWPEKSEDQI